MAVATIAVYCRRARPSSHARPIERCRMPGNGDFDGDVDGADSLAFRACFGGSDTSAEPPSRVFDLLTFQACFTGSR